MLQLIILSIFYSYLIIRILSTFHYNLDAKDTVEIRIGLDTKLKLLYIDGQQVQLFNPVLSFLAFKKNDEYFLGILNI